MPKLTMFIGIPCSGKSTYLKRMLKSVDTPYYVASSDRFIEEWAVEDGLSYSEVFQTRADEAMDKMYKEVMQAIKDKKDVFWDQTNLTIKSRRKKLHLFPVTYLKEAMYFSIPKDLHERLTNREKETGKHIPENVIGQMITYLNEPTVDEGFDLIITFYDEDGDGDV